MLYSYTMRTITSVFFDIDGTLTSFTTNDVPRSARDAVEICRQKGIKTALATGRSPQELQAVQRTLDMDFDGCVCMTGQIAYDGKGTYRDEYLKHEEIELFIGYLQDHPNISVHFSEKDYGYFNRIGAEVTKLYKDLGGTVDKAVIDDPMRALDHNIYQFSMFVPLDVEKELDTMFTHIRPVRWHPDFADFIPADGGKDKGIQAMLDAWGLGREGCVVFGDGGNDIDMLDYAGIGVAMGNAHPSVKSHADYVTQSVDDDGVYKALKHFGIV